MRTPGPFDPGAVGAEYVYRAVADHLAARIASGELPAGSRLPGERDLAEDIITETGQQSHTREVAVTVTGQVA